MTYGSISFHGLGFQYGIHNKLENEIENESRHKIEKNMSFLQWISENKCERFNI